MTYAKTSSRQNAMYLGMEILVTSPPRPRQYASKSRYHCCTSELHFESLSSSLGPLITCSSAGAYPKSYSRVIHHTAASLRVAQHSPLSVQTGCSRTRQHRQLSISQAASLGSVSLLVQRSGTGCCVPHRRRPRSLPPIRIPPRRRDRDAAAAAGL